MTAPPALAADEPVAPVVNVDQHAVHVLECGFHFNFEQIIASLDYEFYPLGDSRNGVFDGFQRGTYSMVPTAEWTSRACCEAGDGRMTVARQEPQGTSRHAPAL
jgi:hypothetical protein